MNKRVKEAIKFKRYTVLFELIENPKAKKYLKNKDILNILLEIACFNFNKYGIKVIENLFKLGANPNHNKDSLFLIQILTGEKLELLNLFIKYEVDLHMKSKYNQNTILIVSSSNIESKVKFDFLKVLVKFRVDINCTEKYFYSSFFHLFSKHEKSCNLLLKRGLNIKFGYKNKSILEYFCKSTKKKIDIVYLKYLIESTSKDDIELEYQKIIGKIELVFKKKIEKSKNNRTRPFNLQEIESKKVDSFIIASFKQRLNNVRRHQTKR